MQLLVQQFRASLTSLPDIEIAAFLRTLWYAGLRDRELMQAVGAELEPHLEVDRMEPILAVQISKTYFQPFLKRKKTSKTIHSNLTRRLLGPRKKAILI
jgi:hypothetical protein